MLLNRLMSSGSPYVAYDFATDFKRNQYYVGGLKQSSLSAMAGYTFTRTGEQGAEDSSGAVSYFAANNPAITNNGFYSYPALTNYVPNSQQINAAGGFSTFAGTSFTSTDTQVAPDGTTTAEENYYSGSGQIYIGLTGFVGVGTLSVYAKTQGGGSTLRLKGYDGTTDYPSGDLAIGDTWGRIAFASTVGGGTHGQFAIQNRISGVAQSLYNWQAQLIAGNFVRGGPILRTTGAAGGIGDCTLSVGCAPTDKEELFFATGTPDDFNRDGVYENILAHLTDASTNNSIRMRVGTTGLPGVIVTAGGVGVYTASAAGAISPDTEVTVVLLRQGGNWRGGTVIGGVLTWFGAATAGAFPAGIDTAMLGHRNSTSHTRGPLKGVFIRPGTYGSDAAVLSAVNETL